MSVMIKNIAQMACDYFISKIMPNLQSRSHDLVAAVRAGTVTQNTRNFIAGAMAGENVLRKAVGNRIIRTLPADEINRLLTLATFKVIDSLNHEA